MLLGFSVFLIPLAGAVASVVGLTARPFNSKAEGCKDGVS